MHRLLEATNLYDVLGVWPEASGDEIAAEYIRLIHAKGYRLGLPRRDWPERVAQIKAAYVTLGDPARRRAYDQSLLEVAETPLWAGSAPDAATDQLVRPAAGEPFYSNAEDEVAPAEASAGWADLAAEHHGGRLPRREAGVVAAMIAGLGMLLYASWPGEAPSSADVDGGLGEPAAASQAGAGALPPGLSAMTDSGTEDAAEPTVEREIFAGDPGGAAASLSAWFGPEAPIDLALPPDLSGAAGMGLPSGAGAAPKDAPASAPPADAPAPSVAPPAPAAEAPPEAPAAAPPDKPAAPRSDTEAAKPAVKPTAGKAAVAKPVSNPSLVSGGPSDADNRGGRYRGAVVVQFAVNSDGRVSSCSPVRSSGNRDLDALTCRLLVNRARFRPARDAQGRAVETDAHATYHWGRGRRGRS